MSIPKNIEISLPWRSIVDVPEAAEQARSLTAELKREAPHGHLLHAREVVAVAARVDRDDVLFEVNGTDNPLAVFHLTWQRETNPQFPLCKLFRSWEDWVREDMLPSREDYML